MPAMRPRFAPKESTSAPAARATSAVRSVEPSSTTSTSTSGSSPCSSRSASGRLASSFQAGMKTTVSAWVDSMRAVWHGARTPWARAGRGTTAWLDEVSVELRHHVLDLRVILERVRREVLPVARLLVAAVGHLGDERDVVVDPDRAELERPRRAQCAADVARPD